MDIINQLEIKKFKYNKIIKKMGEYEYNNRYSSFAEILSEIEKMWVR